MDGKTWWKFRRHKFTQFLDMFKDGNNFKQVDKWT